MNKRYTTSAFTLVELIVAITIFWMIMVSVLSVFLFSSQMSTRVELSRNMQENMKNIIEDIAEWVRKYGIEGVKDPADFSVSMIDAANTFYQKSGLHLNNGDRYMIGHEDSGVPWVWQPSTDIVADCQAVESECRILKSIAGWDYFPMTNNFISVRDLSFTLSNPENPKVMLHITARPAVKKWLSVEIIENNTFYIQTTLSQRVIQTK